MKTIMVTMAITVNDDVTDDDLEKLEEELIVAAVESFPELVHYNVPAGTPEDDIDDSDAVHVETKVIS
jgi:hypothetical protein